jgi:hypothetical protein
MDVLNKIESDNTKYKVVYTIPEMYEYHKSITTFCLIE